MHLAQLQASFVRRKISFEISIYTQKRKKKRSLGHVSSLHFCVETDQNQTDMGLNIEKPRHQGAHTFQNRKGCISHVPGDISNYWGDIVYSVPDLLSHFQLVVFLHSLTNSCPSTKEGFVHDMWGWSAFPVKSSDPI